MTSVLSQDVEMGTLNIRFLDSIAKIPGEMSYVSLSFDFCGSVITLRRPTTERVSKCFQRVELKMAKILGGGRNRNSRGQNTDENSKSRVSIAVPGAPPIETSSHTDFWRQATVFILTVKNILNMGEAMSGFSHTVTAAEDDRNERTFSYHIALNAPRITSCQAHSFPMVGFPLLPYLKTEFLDASRDCTFSWERHKRAADGVRRNGVPISQGHLLYIPSIEDVDHLLVFRCAAHSSSGTIIDVAECEWGPVLLKPPSPKGLFSALVVYGNVRNVTSHLPTAAHRILSYNILHENLMKDTQPSDILCFDEGYRKQLVLAELMRSGANIISLQECSTRLFEEYLLPAMRILHGFDGTCASKAPPSTEGCGVLFRTNDFNLIYQRTISISEQLFEIHPSATLPWGGIKEIYTHAMQKYTLPHICQYVILEEKHRVKPKRVIVCNTHLFYHNDAGFVRNIQTAVVLDIAKSMMKEWNIDSMILSGDLNSTPETGVIEFLHLGHLYTDHKEFSVEALVSFDNIQKRVPRTCKSDSDEDKCCDPKFGNFEVKWIHKAGTSLTERAPVALSHPFQFQSCFDVRSPPLTIYNAAFIGTLDWLFFHGVKEIKTLPILSEAELHEFGSLPSAIFPSDHLSIAVDFRL